MTPSKIYRGTRDGDYHRITVELVNGMRENSLYPLDHVVFHSPTGMTWGYGGSGPADLALSILADHFGERADAILPGLRRYWEPQTKAGELHQSFKFDKVATQHGDSFVITSAEIDLWLAMSPQQARLDAVEARNRELAEVDDGS